MRAAIWGLLRASDAEVLAAAVQTLARRHGTRTFTPHVTVLGGLTLRGDEPSRELLTRARELAASVAAFDVEASAPQHSAAPLRAVVLPLAPTPELLALRRALRELGVRGAEARSPSAGGDYSPHISLIYGALPSATRAAIARDELARALARRWTIDALALVSAGASTWRDVTRWRELGRVALAGAPERAG